VYNRKKISMNFGSLHVKTAQILKRYTTSQGRQANVSCARVAPASGCTTYPCQVWGVETKTNARGDANKIARAQQSALGVWAQQPPGVQRLVPAHLMQQCRDHCHHALLVLDRLVQQMHHHCSLTLQAAPASPVWGERQEAGKKASQCNHQTRPSAIACLCSCQADNTRCQSQDSTSTNVHKVLMIPREGSQVLKLWTAKNQGGLKKLQNKWFCCGF
jgi:hypothetical protein